MIQHLKSLSANYRLVIVCCGMVANATVLTIVLLRDFFSIFCLDAQQV